jgi:hypothetical protein
VSTLVFTLAVVAFVAAGVVLVRRTQRGAFVERLPLDDGEEVLLEEEGVRVWHRFRRTARFGRSGVETRGARVVLTDRRIVVATGGPAGRRKFVLLLVVDYTGPSPPATGSGYGAWRRKFRLDRGYPTYGCSRDDLTLAEEGDRSGVRVVVPFPERGERWGDPPEVVLYTRHPELFLEHVAAHAADVR